MSPEFIERSGKLVNYRLSAGKPRSGVWMRSRLLGISSGLRSRTMRPVTHSRSGAQWFLSDRTDSNTVVAEISLTLRLPTRRGRPGPESGNLSDRQCSGPSPIAFGAKEFHTLDFALVSVQLLV